MPFRTLLFLILLSPVFVGAQIDLEKTFFGVEYTFQDMEMVKEPGRSTMSTPHKEAKAKEVAENLVSILGLKPDALKIKKTWKPGWYVHSPKESFPYVINSEPVVIEVNTGPKRLSEVRASADPIFKAAEMAGLKPYMQPAAERSGMGHIHVGGPSLVESPWGQHPHLLRNVFAFMHKHPSLLYGFSEAYDLGKNSNIETYHEAPRQKALEAAVLAYDNLGESRGGLSQFLSALRKQDGRHVGFFEHYRFVNLEHLSNIYSERDVLSAEGKSTVEFRMFRPPKSPQHAEALAEMLVAILEYQSRPGHKEAFKSLTAAESLKFMSTFKVLDDWQKVRSLLKIKNPLLDEMVLEYHEATSRRAQRINLSGREWLIKDAYSPKELKGTYFEILTQDKPGSEIPVLEQNGKSIDLERITVGKNHYWLGVLVFENISKANAFFKKPTDFIKHGKARLCRRAY